MTAKSQPGFFPELLRNPQYSGTFSTLIYNWPIFAGILGFGLAALISSAFLTAPWSWLFLAAGVGAIVIIFNILVASFIVYDFGPRREYDRLAELANLSEANLVIDITCGKVRGTQGLLARFNRGHYFVLDIYDPHKMPDAALRRARAMTPPLDTDRRIYRRTAKVESLPMPHNWADVIYCSFSLHELHDAADRQKIFSEFTRILKPNGKLLIAEHDRDWLNFIAFGPGVYSFFSAATWTKHITEAGLVVNHHERWRGLAHLWVAERKPR
ncbi:MAG: methyltransferase domain-containing protein [Anaerolineaceae bacterium]|nr:methyltransferase domain-containing protein [Anaerolineaceae bacterium]MCB9102383.1 methyltransferase domain-containing protein [Anaerolineales bacterium]